MSQILKNVKKKLNIITLRNEDKKDKKEDKEDKEDKDKQKYLFNEFINMSITIFEDMLNKNKFDKTNSLVVGNTYLNNMIELLQFIYDDKQSNYKEFTNNIKSILDQDKMHINQLFVLMLRYIESNTNLIKTNELNIYVIFIFIISKVLVFYKEGKSLIKNNKEQIIKYLYNITGYIINCNLKSYTISLNDYNQLDKKSSLSIAIYIIVTTLKKYDLNMLNAKLIRLVHVSTKHMDEYSKELHLYLHNLKGIIYPKEISYTIASNIIENKINNSNTFFGLINILFNKIEVRQNNTINYNCCVCNKPNVISIVTLQLKDTFNIVIYCYCENCLETNENDCKHTLQRLLNNNNTFDVLHKNIFAIKVRNVASYIDNLLNNNNRKYDPLYTNDTTFIVQNNQNYDVFVNHTIDDSSEQKDNIFEQFINDLTKMINKIYLNYFNTYIKIYIDSIINYVNKLDELQYIFNPVITRIIDCNRDDYKEDIDNFKKKLSISDLMDHDTLNTTLNIIFNNLRSNNSSQQYQIYHRISDIKKIYIIIFVNMLHLIYKKNDELLNTLT
jgi:hypothetical protein